MKIRVMMIPHLSQFDSHESGIKRVVEGYFRYMHEFDVEYVDRKSEDFDLYAVHAGLWGQKRSKRPIVSHCHGLYWTADYRALKWEWQSNADVINVLKQAEEVTVPSNWVAKTLQRDMHIFPHVISHAIDVSEWKHDIKHQNYVLWNKNRNVDVCDPSPVTHLARRARDINFITTYKTENAPGNITDIGLASHKRMKEIIQHAGVYLSTTKETFGIGVLEAMASGVPVLGFRHGGNLDLVKHGVTGYLAAVNNYDDLENGLRYCIKYRDILGHNSIEYAKKYNWRNVCEEVANVYKMALNSYLDRKRPYK